VVGGELGKARLAADDVAGGDDQPLDVVVDQLQQVVQVLGVEQVEVASHEGQVVLDPAFTRLPIFLGGSSGHRLHLQLRIAAVLLGPAEHHAQARP
jgi:hypothetical protein